MHDVVVLDVISSDAIAPGAEASPPSLTGPTRPGAPAWARDVLALAGFALCGAALGLAWVGRDRLADTAGDLASLLVDRWYVVVPVALIAVAVLLVAGRSSTPKSAAHPALRVRRNPTRPRRRRPFGRGVGAPNVFVDGDSFARAAWPDAGLDDARRWTVEASERVASRFGTDVAVVVGAGAATAPGRDHVRVLAVDECGSMREALWELVGPVDPELPMILVTDDPEVAHSAQAHGVRIMPCRAWMALADRLTVPG